MIDHIPRIVLELVRLAVWLAVLSAIFAPLERLFAERPQKFFRKQIAVDAGYYFINGLVPGLVLGLPMAVVVAVSHRVIPGAALDAIAAWPMWLRASAAMVVGETDIIGRTA